MRLFHYMTFIDLSNFFAAFNTNILLKFTKFYPIIFFPHDIWLFDDQFKNYYENV